jgi:hypothetical protein
MKSPVGLSKNSSSVGPTIRRSSNGGNGISLTGCFPRKGFNLLMKKDFIFSGLQIEKRDISIRIQLFHLIQLCKLKIILDVC